MLDVAATGILCCGVLVSGGLAYAQGTPVSAHVKILEKANPKVEKSSANPADLSEIVAWLKPLDRAAAKTFDESPLKKFQLIQRNKSFQPHVLVLPVGTTVDFPNRDPFFHNVFSLFDGKRFDLGLYEAGATNSVRFDRLGISFLFCNIHPEMSAVVIAVDTPYYGVSDHAGNVTIPNVPNGEYELHVWYERSLPKDLKLLTRTVNVSSTTRDLGEIGIQLNPQYSPAHKNKDGQDYVPPHAPAYSQP